MKYNVGDKVRIKSIDWYNQMLAIKDKQAYRTTPNGCEFIGVWCSNRIFKNDMIKFCGQVMTIKAIENEYYIMHEDTLGYWYCDEMIEGLVGEEINPEPKFKVGDVLFYRGETSGYLKVEEIREENGEIRYYETSRNLYLVENDPDVFAVKVCSVEIKETKNNNNMEEKETLLGWVKESDSLRLVPHKDYEIKHDGDNFYLVKKNKEYPKTYEESCKVLNIAVRDLDILDNMLDTTEIIYTKNLDRLLNSFRKLLICCDAYWKIAGEEMGLGKPWEPDWQDDTTKYTLVCINNGIEKDWELHINHILAFPTKEIRDAFYEAFKEEIEECKELL